MIKFKPDLKLRLIDLRQDPEYSELKSDFRQILKYIEKLEKEVVQQGEKLSKTGGFKSARITSHFLPKG